MDVDGLPSSLLRLAFQLPGLWWCKHRDRRDAEMENEVMANKQAKPKAATEVDTKITNKPVRDSEQEPERRNRQARSRTGTAQIDRARATAASTDGAVVHDKSKQSGSRLQSTAGRTDVGER